MPSAVAGLLQRTRLGGFHSRLRFLKVLEAGYKDEALADSVSGADPWVCLGVLTGHKGCPRPPGLFRRGSHPNHGAGCTVRTSSPPKGPTDTILVVSIPQANFARLTSRPLHHLPAAPCPWLSDFSVAGGAGQSVLSVHQTQLHACLVLDRDIAQAAALV